MVNGFSKNVIFTVSTTKNELGAMRACVCIFAFWLPSSFLHGVHLLGHGTAHGHRLRLHLRASAAPSTRMGSAVSAAWYAATAESAAGAGATTVVSKSAKAAGAAAGAST